jgi:uncharacterized membrane protein
MVSWSLRFRVRQYIRYSLWVVPMLGGVAGVLLSWVSADIDESVTLPVQWQYTQNTATTLLTTIVGAMVGLLGLVVTIGVLVVQQATSSLSPRFMRLWYSQHLQKAVLATFAGTFAFAFGNLRRVSDSFVPDVGITLSAIACAGSVLMLLIYLDSFTHHLRPVAVASLVARRGQRVLTTARSVLMAHPGLDEAAITTGEPSLRISSPRAGAVQAVHASGLLAQAERHDCTLVLTCSVGDFVPAGVTVIEVYGQSIPTPESLLGCMAFGDERTIEQDPGFAMRILVDIAIRALSPAVNDPTTAVQVLNHLETLLQALSKAPLPGAYALDDATGRHRVVVPGRRWEDYLELGLTEIRQYGATSTQVCRRLAALLDALAESASPERQAAVERQRTLLADIVDQSFSEPAARERARQPDRQGIGGRRTAPTIEADGQVGGVGRTSAG